MRLQSKLLYVFLAMLLVIASIVEASKGHKKKKNKKRKGKKPTSSTLATSGSGGGIPVQRTSGPKLEPKKMKDNKTNFGKAPSSVEGSRCEIVPFAGSESVTSSVDVVGDEFRSAVDGEDLGWLNRNHDSWGNRKYLLNYLIEKGVDVTVWFIQKVEGLYTPKQPVLAALFDKGEKGMIDGVLGRIEYDVRDLWNLTDYRPELAGSPEKFLNVLDKIEDPEWQESAVRVGVANLFKAEKHDLVVPLVDALGERTFKSERLKEGGIQQAFYEGAERGNQDIVELYCEHPAITSEEYAYGLNASWNKGNPNQVFQLLLKQADQGDLDEAKEKYADGEYETFRQAIAKAPEPIPPAGSRHLRPIERASARIAKNTLNELGHPGLSLDVVNIITGYSTADPLLHVRARVAKRVLEGSEGPGLPTVPSTMIAEYMDNDDDMLAHGQEQERMLQEQTRQ